MTAVRGPLGVRPLRCVRGLGLILRPRRCLSGLADIPDFTESDSTGLNWFVCWFGPCFAGFECPQGLADIPDFADVRVTDSAGLDWRHALGPLMGSVLPGKYDPRPTLHLLTFTY